MKIKEDVKEECIKLISDYYMKLENTAENNLKRYYLTKIINKINEV